jgi:hypothetical protein
LIYWLADLLDVCVSDAIAYEYEDVLARKLNKQRWQKIQPVLGALLNHAQLPQSIIHGDQPPQTQATTL